MQLETFWYQWTSIERNTRNQQIKEKSSRSVLARMHKHKHGFLCSQWRLERWTSLHSVCIHLVGISARDRYVEINSTGDRAAQVSPACTCVRLTPTSQAWQQRLHRWKPVQFPLRLTFPERCTDHPRRPEEGGTGSYHRAVHKISLGQQRRINSRHSINGESWPDCLLAPCFKYMGLS